MKNEKQDRNAKKIMNFILSFLHKQQSRIIMMKTHDALKRTTLAKHNTNVS